MQTVILVSKKLFYGAAAYLYSANLLTVLPSQQVFFIGLALLVVANGLFKPNVSSIVGTLYRTDDPRRDGGFTLFYMGINVGSLIPPIFIGTVVYYYGWHAGFLFAAHWAWLLV